MNTQCGFDDVLAMMMMTQVGIYIKKKQIEIMKLYVRWRIEWVVDPCVIICNPLYKSINFIYI